MTALEQVGKHASDVTYGSAVVTVIGGLTLNEWLAVTGIVIGIASFIVNWAYKHKTWRHIRGPK